MYHIDPAKSKELLRRFEKLSDSDKKELISSICKNKQSAEDANEAFEAILGKLLGIARYALLDATGTPLL